MAAMDLWQSLFLLWGGWCLRISRCRQKDPIATIDICVCERLLVNGGEALEAWLPYNVRSEPDAIISSRLYSGKQQDLDAELEQSGGEKQYPTERVRFIKATGIDECETVKLGDKDVNTTIPAGKK